MKRAVTVVAMSLLFAFGAFAADAKTDYDHSVDFTKYHTFGWKAAKGASNGVVNNSLVASRIENAVEQNLVQKGLRPDKQGPDVYVVAYVGAKNMRDIDYLPAAPGWRHWGWMGRDVVVNRYVEGKVILDMVDARTNQLVWRAISTQTGDTLIDVQKEKNIDKMVKEAFKHFPPKVES